MIAIPNCCLIRAGEDYVVDPGVMMQGAPVTASLRKRGIEPHETKVILTHNHF
jgi:glyoxylase-like metal-dependent hydrolase (beta-lactamase superfamily II)